jgi:hypothetical protein
MSNLELIEQIKQLSELINKALLEAGENRNISFQKALIQQNAIDIYQKALLLDVQAIEKKSPEIRVIRQEEVISREVLPSAEEPAKPVLEKQPDIEVAPARVEETPVQENPIQEPVHIPEKTNIPEPAPEPVLKPMAPPTVQATPPSTAPKPKILQEVDDQELSLNEKLSKNKQPVINVADKSKGTPISDLVKFISIGKKFEFINGLFDGNSEAYRSTLNTVQNAASYEEATEFLGSGISGTYGWDEQEALAAEFFSLVKRRFSK